MKVSSSAIKSLLEITARKQFVNSKPQQQVIGSVIRPSQENDKATTTSLERDANTSLGSLSFEWIIIPSTPAFIYFSALIIFSFIRRPAIKL